MNNNGGWTGEAEEAWGCVLLPVKIFGAFLFLVMFYFFVVFSTIALTESYDDQLGWIPVDGTLRTFVAIVTMAAYLVILWGILWFGRSKLPWWADYFSGLFGLSILVDDASAVYSIIDGVVGKGNEAIIASPATFNSLIVWVSGIELVCFVLYCRLIVDKKPKAG